MGILVTLTMSLSLLMVLSALVVERMNKQCSGIWLHANTCTLSPVELRLTLFASLPLVTGSALLRVLRSRSGTWRISCWWRSSASSPPSIRSQRRNPNCLYAHASRGLQTGLPSLLATPIIVSTFGNLRTPLNKLLSKVNGKYGTVFIPFLPDRVWVLMKIS